MSDKLYHLSKDLKNWRAERPDEWTMDRFIRVSSKLESDYKELKEENTDLNISIRKVTDQRDMAIEALESLKELSGFYYKRGVPHQYHIEHCMCRECTDKRVYKSLITLSKLKDNQDI